MFAPSNQLAKMRSIIMNQMLIMVAVMMTGIDITEEENKYRVQYRFFLHWASPKRLKYGKPRLGESTLT